MYDVVKKGNVQPKIVLEMTIDERGASFSDHICKAIEQAEIEITHLNETIESVKKMKPDCDRLDYILAASSGALCGVIDIFLVGSPKDSVLGKLTDKWFAEKTKAFAKLLHPKGNDFDSLESAILFLEKKFKVPYDQRGLGDAGKVIFDLDAYNHHFKSLAHNPSILGLFFSLLDQFTNSSHFVTDGGLVSLEEAENGWELYGKNIPSKLFCGIINWFGHLVSDMSGSQSSARNGNRGMGIPSPLWTWTNDIIAIKSTLHIPVSETDKSMNQLALTIFEKGYDARFQAAQAIPVFINELFVRFIYSVRRLMQYFKTVKQGERSPELMWKMCELFSNATVKRMLTVAHGTFCLIDVGDATVRAIVSSGGGVNVHEFVMRLNIIGIGKLVVSLYGEAERAFVYHGAIHDAEFAERERTVVENYLQGLRILSEKYNDRELVAFIHDFKKSDAYITAFEKTVSLAELRDVPSDNILRNKMDIDTYFGG